MSIELPRPIADYFEADRSRDPEAVARCFTDDGLVRDEGHAYAGRDEIRRWMADSSRKYTYTVEPLAVSAEGSRTIVTSRLVGNFPGSPIDLRYLFDLSDQRIAGLEIKP